MIHDNIIHIIGHELNRSPYRQTDTHISVALTVSLHELELHLLQLLSPATTTPSSSSSLHVTIVVQIRLLV